MLHDACQRCIEPQPLGDIPSLAGDHMTRQPPYLQWLAKRQGARYARVLLSHLRAQLRTMTSVGKYVASVILTNVTLNVAEGEKAWFIW